jgi:hypothetical protein
VLLFFVTTGLDPVVDYEIKPAIAQKPPLRMDARAKPGHDETTPSLSVSPA